MFNTLLNKVFGKQPATATPRQWSAQAAQESLEHAQNAYRTTLQRLGRPRIALVKQDINEDLYCCPPGTRKRAVVESTLMRSGPAELFREFDADFHIVETVTDPECSVWEERATKLKWDSLEFFRSYQTHIPGRDYGQREFSQAVEHIDWSRYDIVISIDNSIPARITQRFPKTLWAYYVREIKVPEYRALLQRSLPGQDVVLSHEFFPEPKPKEPHVIDFPYHLQRYGCLQTLFGAPLLPEPERRGVFVDHHTMITLSPAERTALTPFGPVASTIHSGDREVIPTSEQLARRTLDVDLRERLCQSRYFLCTPGKRTVFGTAIVEAIAAGCLMIGTRDRVGCPFLLTEATNATDSAAAVNLMNVFENHPEELHQEVQRQRDLVDWLCFYRPCTQLLERWAAKVS